MKRILLGLVTALALVFLGGCACHRTAASRTELTATPLPTESTAAESTPVEMAVLLDGREPGELEEAELDFEDGCAHERLEWDILVPGGCETEGRGVYRCVVCGETLRQETIPPTGHRFSYGSSAGEHWQVCSACSQRTATEGHSFDDKGVCKVCGYGCAHEYREQMVSPTCAEEGCTLHTCSLCNHQFKDDYQPCVPHVYIQGKCIWCGASDFSGVSGASWSDIFGGGGIELPEDDLGF